MTMSLALCALAGWRHGSNSSCLQTMCVQTSSSQNAFFFCQPSDDVDKQILYWSQLTHSNAEQRENYFKETEKKII